MSNLSQGHNLAQIVDRKSAEVESILLSVIGRLTSWIAPIPTVMMTSAAIADIFEVGPGIAMLSSVSLEIVGISTSNHWLSLLEYNRTKKVKQPEANVRLALWMMVAYFGIDVAIIAAKSISDAIARRDGLPLIAFLFPVANAIGQFVLAERVAHFHRMEEIATEEMEKKEERKVERERKRLEKAEAAALPVETGGNAMEMPEVPGYAMATLDWFRGNAMATNAAAAAALGISERTVRNHLAIAREAGVAHRNGNGWEIKSGGVL